MIANTETYVKKIQHNAIVVCYEEFDIQPIELDEDEIVVQNTDGLIVEFNESLLTNNLVDKGQGIPTIYRVMIDTIPERDFLSIGGSRITSRKIISLADFNNLIYTPLNVGLDYSFFYVKLLASNALTDEWSEALKIKMNIIGVLSWETP